MLRARAIAIEPNVETVMKTARLYVGTFRFSHSTLLGSGPGTTRRRERSQGLHRRRGRAARQCSAGNAASSALQSERHRQLLCGRCDCAWLSNARPCVTLGSEVPTPG